MKNTLSLILFLLSYSVFGQTEYVHQVLLLNEGRYDYYEQEIIEPVSVGIYNPSTNLYNTIIELDNARFASDLIIFGDYFYVAADNKVFKYDLNSYELIAEQDAPGVRKMAIYDNYLFITKGDYDSATFSSVIFDSYLDVFSASDLSFVMSFDISNGPQWSTENIIINEDKLYVAINNGYEWGNYKGIIGIVDLSTMDYAHEVDLGEDGKNPVNMMFKNNSVYTINNKNWDGSSISMVNVADLETETINLSNVSAGCGVSIIRNNNLLYQLSSDYPVYSFDLLTLENSNPIEGLIHNYYAITINPINGYTYTSVSNFVSNSSILIYDVNSNLVNSFFSGVATGKIVFDVRNETSSILENNLVSLFNTSVDILGRSSIQDNMRIIISLDEDGDIEKQYLLNK